jgi:hypothetical protein
LRPGPQLGRLTRTERKNGAYGRLFHVCRMHLRVDDCVTPGGCPDKETQSNEEGSDLALPFAAFDLTTPKAHGHDEFL